MTYKVVLVFLGISFLYIIVYNGRAFYRLVKLTIPGLFQIGDLTFASLFFK